MIIGIDGNEANVKERVGVSVYTYELLLYFKRHASRDLRFKIYLRAAPRADLPDANEFFEYKVIWGPKFWLTVFFPLALMVEKIQSIFHLSPLPDVLFSPAHYVPPYLPMLSVVTIHDLSYFYFPDEFLKKDLYKLTKWTKSAVEKATSVIAVSKWTKKDIEKYYPSAEQKTKVIYNGFRKAAFGKNSSRDPMRLLYDFNILPHRYILYVGTLQPRKNITTLITAFAAFYKTHPDFKLVLVGRKGWLYDEILKKSETLGIKDAVLFTGYLNDDDLSIFYRQAFAYVMPSLYEGFGIPVLEAMSEGCPVIASFASSLPEVGSDAASYFDPKSAEGLCSDLEDFFTDNGLREDYIKKGNERVKEFSWEKCGKETLTLLTSINPT